VPPCRGTAKILISENRLRNFGHSQGNALSLLDSRDVWIDHCSFDSIRNKDNKHINVKQGSTGVTISNNRFSNTDYVRTTCRELRVCLQYSICANNTMGTNVLKSSRADRYR